MYVTTPIENIEQYSKHDDEILKIKNGVFKNMWYASVSKFKMFL